MAAKSSTPTLVGLITGALALVAALAWNDAIQRAMTALLGEKGATVWAGFLYAFAVTLIVVVAVWLVQRGQKAAKSLGAQLRQKDQKQKAKKETDTGLDSSSAASATKKHSTTSVTDGSVD